MPNVITKIILTFSVFFAFFALPVCNALENKTIKIADSLYENKNFDQALHLYAVALDSEQFFSRHTLSRLALMEESSENIVMALYYLSTLYYYYTDTRIIRKMESLGDRYHLSGYGYTELEYFVSLYKEYYYLIIFSLIGIGVPFIIYLFRRRKQGLSLGIRPLFFLIILGSVFYLNNVDITPVMGVISTPTTLMSGASPGSESVENIIAGHRVRVIDKDGVWYKIAWKGKELYLRDIDLLVIGNSHWD